MGPRAVVEMVIDAPNRGYYVEGLVGDLDATTMSEVKEKVPNGKEIKKMADKNHWRKGISRLLKGMKESTYSRETKILTEVQRTRLEKYIMIVINNNQGEKQNMILDFKALPKHLFFDHSICRTGICIWKGKSKEEELKVPHFLRFKGEQLQSDIEYVVDTILLNIDQVVNLGSSNYNEYGHATISHICLKNVHHAKSRKYQVLINLGITRINDGMKSIQNLIFRNHLPIPKSQVNNDHLSRMDREQKKRKEYRARPDVMKRTASRKKQSCASLVAAGCKHTGVYKSDIGLQRYHQHSMKEMASDPSLIFGLNIDDEKKDAIEFEKAHGLSSEEAQLSRRINFGDTETTGSRLSDQVFEYGHQFLHQSKPFQAYSNTTSVVTKWTSRAKSITSMKSSDVRVTRAAHCDAVAEQYENLIRKFSGDSAVMIFKNWGFDRRLISQNSNFNNEGMIWLEATTFMNKIPSDISESKKLGDIYMYNNEMNILVGAHGAGPDTKATKDLCLEGCGGVKNFLVFANEYVRAVKVNGGTPKGGIGCGCKSKKCKNCNCTKKNLKCGPWCGCGGECVNTEENMKAVIICRREVAKKKRKIYQEIIKRRPQLQNALPKPVEKKKKEVKKKKKKKKKKKEKNTKKRTRVRGQHSQIITRAKKKRKNNDGDSVDVDKVANELVESGIEELDKEEENNLISGIEL